MRGAPGNRFPYRDNDEGRTDGVHENTEDDNKVSSGTRCFLREDAPMLGELATVNWLVGKTCRVRVTNRG